MRILRTVGAALVWVLATVLLVLAVVLSITIVLLPVGILLGFASMRLYRLGLKWALPRASDVAKAARTQARRWRRDPAVQRLRHAFSAGTPHGRKRHIQLPRRRGRKRSLLRNLGRSG
jgi:hypothetical protein